MRDQDAWPPVRHYRPGEGSEVAGVAVEASRPGSGRQHPRTLRAPLATPVQAPDGEPARDEVAYRLEVFLDEFSEAADQNAMRSRRRRCEMTPTQSRTIGRGEYAPGEAGRLEKAAVERGSCAGGRCRGRQMPVISPIVIHRRGAARPSRRSTVGASERVSTALETVCARPPGTTTRSATCRSSALKPPCSAT